MGLEFLSHGWLYAAPGLLGALTILYFLKLKRREVTVASTFLWKTVLDDMRVNSPLQRLRMNLLLLLQALALLLLVLALARPVAQTGGLKGTDALLLIDVSASMQAVDGAGGETRLQRALADARRVVDDLGFGDRALVMTFADEPRVLTPLTSSKGTLREALDGVGPTERPTRLAPALHRVRALLSDAERNAEVYLFTDGRVGPLEGIDLDARVPVHYVRLGEAAANCGVVGIDVRMAPGGEDTRAFVSVANTGPARAVDLGVDFYLDGELAGSREVSIDAGGVASVPFEVPLPAGSPARRLRVQLDRPDALPADDVAHAVLRPLDSIKVLLVTQGNLFLQSALSEDPIVWKTPRGDVPVLLPEAFDPQDAGLLEYDMIVLDRLRPPSLPPGNYLMWGAAPPFPGFVDQGVAEDARVLDWDELHEVSRFVNFATLVLPTSRRLVVREADHVICRGSQGPLVVEAREGDRRVIACAFDLLSFPVEGAWTFDPAFPIFLANATRWLGSAGGERRSLLARTGGTAELRIPPSATRGQVDPPDHEGRPAPPYDLPIQAGDDALRVTALDRAGIYSVVFRGDGGDAELGTALFAANLVDQEESAIAPPETLGIEGRAPVAAADEALESNKDVWKALAIVALVLVMLEWWVYNRRVYL